MFSSANSAIFCRTDVTDEKSVQVALSKTMEAFGAIHVDINCAGSGDAIKVLGKNGPYPMDRFNFIVQLNLIGTFNVIRLSAEKMVLNMLSTAAMVRLGKTYGNLMVDLQAWSRKLVDRGERIVMEVGGLGREEAGRLIEAAGGSVRTAIVMARTGAARAEAEALLARHDHRVRAILGDPPPVAS